jgi:adenylosuccinate synthase
VAYQLNGKEVSYRPDQEYLNQVKPIFLELPAWDGEAIKGIKKIRALPLEAKQYISFLCQSLRVKPLIITTGPKREQTIKCF